MQNITTILLKDYLYNSFISESFFYLLVKIEIKY